MWLEFSPVLLVEEVGHTPCTLNILPLPQQDSCVPLDLLNPLFLPEQLLLALGDKLLVFLQIGDDLLHQNRFDSM